MTEHDPQHPSLAGNDIRATPYPSDDNPSPDTTVTQTGSEKKQPSMLREIIETALLALFIFVAVRAVVLNFKVDGVSMNPSFEDGEMLLVNRNAYRSINGWTFVDWLPFVDDHHDADAWITFGEPKRGDVIVFTPPPPGEDKPYIKRVIGLPGDTVEIHDDGVYVNGTRLEEPYLEGRTSNCRHSEPEFCGTEVVIPEGSVFVMGDNRNNSEDSRKFGPVEVHRIIGKAWVTYWPKDHIGVVPHFEYPNVPEAPDS